MAVTKIITALCNGKWLPFSEGNVATIFRRKELLPIS